MKYRGVVFFSLQVTNFVVENGYVVGMGTIPIPSIDTVNICELGASIDTYTKYRLFRYCARAVYVQRACAKTCVVKLEMFVKCVNAVLNYTSLHYFV